MGTSGWGVGSKVRVGDRGGWYMRGGGWGAK